MKNSFYGKLLLVLFASFFWSGVQAQHKGLPLKGICAHRGGVLNTHPENTLPAFKEAIRLGVQMIEFDVRMTKDSVLVIMHDPSVDRTTNGSGNVENLTYAEISKLDAGVKKGPEFINTKVPTMEEVLNIMPVNVWLNCDVKGPVGTALAAFAIAKKQKRLHQVIFACNEMCVNALKKEWPGVITCNMEAKFRKETGKYTESSIRLKTDFVQLTRPMKLDVQFLEKLKGNGIYINYFFAKEPGELDTLFPLNVDFVLVNDIPAFEKTALKYGIKPVKYIYPGNL